jgi:type I restriction enzyme, S subunit
VIGVENSDKRNRAAALPNGWAWAALDEFCAVTQGQSPPGETYNTSGDGLPFFQGKAEFGPIYPTPVKWCSAPTKVAKPEDVLISIRAPVGPTNLCPSVACIGRGLAAVRPLAAIPPRFVLYGLRSTQDALTAKGTGSTFEAVSGSDLRSHRLPVPPLNEQHRIVAEIEKQFTRLDAAVEALTRSRANLKRYRASVLKAACEGRLVPTEAELARAEERDYEPADVLLTAARDGHTPTIKKRAGQLWGAGSVPELSDTERSRLPKGWAWAKVRQLGSDPEDAVQVGPMSMRSKDFVKDGVPVLNVGCVQWGRFDETKLDFLPQGKATAFDRYTIQPGDVLFTRSGTVGRCAVAKPHQANWLMTFHLLRVRPDDKKCLPAFLRAVFEGAAHISRQTRHASIGTTRAGFNTNLLANLDVPLPPLTEQLRIVAEVDRRLSVIEELEALVRTNLVRAERLRQSILKRALEGKLVQQDPNDEPASVLLERIRAERKAKSEK